MTTTNRPRFKKQARPTGLAAIANPHPHTMIIRKGYEVGMITPPTHGSVYWRAWLRVNVTPTAEMPCPWKFVRLEAKFGREPSARDWLIQYWASLDNELDIHFGVKAA